MGKWRKLTRLIHLITTILTGCTTTDTTAAATTAAIATIAACRPTMLLKWRGGVDGGGSGGCYSEG